MTDCANIGKAIMGNGVVAVETFGTYLFLNFEELYYPIEEKSVDIQILKGSSLVDQNIQKNFKVVLH